MTPPRLRELQQRLRELIFDNGDGSTEALARLERGAAELPIASGGGLSSAARLSIYAGMHFVRIRDVIAEDFPATRAAAGDGFDDLVQRYLRAHPTDDPSLRRAGRHLAGFLERNPGEARFAWQADLAALEAAMIDAFDALDQDVLTAAHLASLDPADWPSLRLEPVRSARLLALAHPVDEIRAELLAGAAPGAGAPEALTLRVWRQGESVFHRRVGTAEARAWRRLGEGAAFGDFCEALAADRSADDAAGEAVDLLRDWLDDELLVALPTT
jgi:hypothetical protein